MRKKMTPGNLRVVILAALHFAIFSLLPAGQVKDSHAVDNFLAGAPTASEIALFEELAEWISEDDLQAIGDEDEPLWQTIRARPASFDVFRSFHGDEIRNQRLRQIPYGDSIARVAERHGVDGLLVAAVVEAESSFQPCAVSHRGAIGLMQLMPATAGARYLNPAAQRELCTPKLNLDLGTRYLSHLLKRYGGDLELALAAYNAGPGRVMGAMRDFERIVGRKPTFWEVRHRLPRETQDYVPRFLATVLHYASKS